MVRIVISAINFTEGGPLTVLRECLKSAATILPAHFEIVAILNRADLVNEPRVRLISIPSSKKSWFHRLYWEWFGFMRISNELNPALWLSLHDISPRVSTYRQVVYCHNAASFYRIGLREALMDPKFFLFNRFYGLLYRVFIRRNYCVIVQQAWLREAFLNRMGKLRIVVAHPLVSFSVKTSAKLTGSKFIFIYPALPRVFKNIETLCKAAQIMSSRSIHCFEVRLTLNGTENLYAQWLIWRFGHVEHIKFIGHQTNDEMVNLYREADAMVFPSKSETWGLPISEAKAYRLPLLVADLPYARETVGNYDLVSFFQAESADALADLMQLMVERKWQPMSHQHEDPLPPFASDWDSLWRILTDGLPTI